MQWDVAGLGNAIMDALVVLEDDALIDELGLTRGTMHPVDHARWQQVYERVRLHKVTFDSGGSCANTIATVGRLGGRALYRGQVGDDQMGHLYASLIEQACGQHGLAYSKEAHTGKCLSIISAADAERTMLTDLGASILLPGLGDFEMALAQTKVAHFEGYTLLGGPMRDTVFKAMGVARAAGAEISVDAADPFVVATIRDDFWAVLRDYATVCFLNEDEARSLSGLQDSEAACEHIAREAGVRIVVVKLGRRGSLIRVDGETLHVGVKLVHAIDSTGAGDSYAGGFLYGLSRGWAPARCGELATRVAALTVSQIGAVVKDEAALQRSIAEVMGA
jgi:sugar/nucleoside kinase (ribokinase family)